MLDGDRLRVRECSFGKTLRKPFGRHLWIEPHDERVVAHPRPAVDAGRPPRAVSALERGEQPCAHFCLVGDCLECNPAPLALAAQPISEFRPGRHQSCSLVARACDSHSSLTG